MDVGRSTLDSTNGSHNQLPVVESPASPIQVDTNCPSVAAEYWCHTQVKITKMRYIWTISNFSFCKDETGDIVKSSLFSSGPNDTLKWCLKINPKGLDEDSKEYLSLYLLLMNSGTKGEARAKFRFSLIDRRRIETKAMESQRAYRFVQGKDWGFKKFIRRDVLFDETSGLLPNDQLTISCEVSVVGDTISECGQLNHQTINVPSNNLHEDFGNMFFNELFTDVELVVISQRASPETNSAKEDDIIVTDKHPLKSISNYQKEECRSDDDFELTSQLYLAGEDDDSIEEEALNGLNITSSVIQVYDSSGDSESESKISLDSCTQSQNEDRNTEEISPVNQCCTSSASSLAHSSSQFVYLNSLNAEDRFDRLSKDSVFDDTQDVVVNPAKSCSRNQSTSISSNRSSNSNIDSSSGGVGSSSGTNNSCTANSSQSLKTPVKVSVANSTASSSPKLVLSTSQSTSDDASKLNKKVRSRRRNSLSNNSSLITNASVDLSGRSVSTASPSTSSSSNRHEQRNKISTSNVSQTKKLHGTTTPSKIKVVPKTNKNTTKPNKENSTQSMMATSTTSTVLPVNVGSNVSKTNITSDKTNSSKEFSEKKQTSITGEDEGTIVVRTFRAHKAVLAARSPVFAAMFEHRMEESRANRVEISDVDADVLAEVLRFIYTGQVFSINKYAPELLATADKYQLERLKLMCEEALLESLCVDNACETLGLADMHNAKYLKMYSLDYVLSHAVEICATEGYEQLAAHRPRLLNECFRNLANQHLPLRRLSRKRPRQS